MFEIHSVSVELYNCAQRRSESTQRSKAVSGQQSVSFSSVVT